MQILQELKFSPGEIFANFCVFLPCVNEATFTVLAKIYSTEHFCNTKQLGLMKCLFSENFQLYSNSFHICEFTSPGGIMCNNVLGVHDVFVALGIVIFILLTLRR